MWPWHWQQTVVAIGEQDKGSCMPRTPKTQVKLFTGYNYTKEVH